MIAFIIWIVGVVLTIKAAMEIFSLKADTVKKLLAIIILLITNWIGLLVYYFYAKDKMSSWLQ